jgi:hypothetical protein
VARLIDTPNITGVEPTNRHVSLKLTLERLAAQVRSTPAGLPACGVAPAPCGQSSACL